MLHSHSSSRHGRCGKEVGRARGVGLYVVGAAGVALTSCHLEALVIVVLHVRAKGPNCASRHVQIRFGHQVADDVQHDSLLRKGSRHEHRRKILAAGIAADCSAPAGQSVGLNHYGRTAGAVAGVGPDPKLGERL